MPPRSDAAQSTITAPRLRPLTPAAVSSTRGLAARDLGGGDDDVKAGGLFVDGSLLLSLLFGAQRAGITALALALGEVKSQIKELRAEGLDLALGGGTHVVRGDDRAKTLQRTDGLQAGDAGTEHQRLSRANRAGLAVVIIGRKEP